MIKKPENDEFTAARQGRFFVVWCCLHRSSNFKDIEIQRLKKIQLIQRYSGSFSQE